MRWPPDERRNSLSQTSVIFFRVLISDCTNQHPGVGNKIARCADPSLGIFHTIHLIVPAAQWVKTHCTEKQFQLKFVLCIGLQAQTWSSFELHQNCSPHSASLTQISIYKWSRCLFTQRQNVEDILVPQKFDISYRYVSIRQCWWFRMSCSIFGSPNCLDKLICISARNRRKSFWIHWWLLLTRTKSQTYRAFQKICYDLKFQNNKFPENMLWFISA